MTSTKGPITLSIWASNYSFNGNFCVCVKSTIYGFPKSILIQRIDLRTDKPIEADELPEQYHLE